MSIGRILILGIAAYITYAILYTVAAMVLYPSEIAAFVEQLSVLGQGNPVLTPIGHLLQTIAIVVLFYMFVANDDLKTGARFGSLAGLYLAGTNMVIAVGTVMPTGLLAKMMITDIVIGTLVGIVLAKIYGLTEKKDTGQT